ncbi:hypothetical protein AAMO2058_001319200 [Amorphochlora amoebiformis]
MLGPGGPSIRPPRPPGNPARDDLPEVDDTGKSDSLPDVSDSDDDDSSGTPVNREQPPPEAQVVQEALSPDLGQDVQAVWIWSG